jgi:hypothetical protein
MATLLGNFESKLVGGTQPGELIRITLRGESAFCVNIEPADGGLIRLGILKWQFVNTPSFFSSEAAAQCVSYGMNWALEPFLGDESRPRNGQGNELGTLYVGNGVATLRLDPDLPLNFHPVAIRAPTVSVTP